PGSTERQRSGNDMMRLRDRDMPELLSMFYRRETFLHSWANRSFENGRRVKQDVRSVENNRKRFDGYIAGLLDPEIWRSIEQRERKLQDGMKADALWQ